MAQTSLLAKEPVTNLEDTPEGPFLEDLFRGLNDAGIDYCVERNYEGLPFSLQGHDLDLLMREEHIGSALDIIRQAAAKHQGRTTRVRWKSEELRWVICVGKSPRGKFWGARIDLKPWIRWHGIQFEDVKDAFRTSFRYRGIRVQDPIQAAFFCFISHTFNGMFYADRQRYDLKVREAYQTSPEKMADLAHQTFGKAGRHLLEIFKTDRFDQLDQVLRKLKLALVKREFIRRPWDVMSFQVKNLFNHARRLFGRWGIFIAILGLDGSGKTTLSEMALKDLADLFHAGMDYYYHRPGLLPYLYEVFGLKKTQNNPANPHAAKPSGLLGSILRLAYYTCDYALGYWLLIHPNVMRHPYVVIFDRYFYGFFIDPRRCRIQAPESLIKFFSWFVPQPDLTVLLYPHPEVFYQRKQELPLKELYQQGERMKALARILKRAVWVDSSGDIEHSRRKIVEAGLEAYWRLLG
jgi:thymidylate kinase